jgi:very-short-patch-repair endonuclease
LADGRAESPQESRLRVRLCLAGLTVPEVQYPIFGRDGFVARVDLAWPQLKIAIEYDGLIHVGSARQMHRDRRRLNRLAAEGWIVLHVTAERLRDDFPGFVAEVRATLRSRRG